MNRIRVLTTMLLVVGMVFGRQQVNKSFAPIYPRTHDNPDSDVNGGTINDIRLPKDSAVGVTAVETADAISQSLTYSNPVLRRSVPDPTIIRAQDGYFYLYGTEDIRNTPIFRSANLVRWLYVGTAFTDATRPSMVPNGGIWAPDINCIGGKYVMYYSKSEWGKTWECGIGVATADKPEGPFTDHGKLFISSEIGVQNSIDPFFIEEDGHNYLFWGSFHGIYGIELSEDGLSLREGAEKKQIAGTLIEGTYIIKHDGYFYLIGSAGTCCNGAGSTYHLMMARSNELFGPYVNKKGAEALYNGFSTLLVGSNDVIAPGHNAEFVQDDAGQYWILYHGYEATEPDRGRVVFLDKVDWGDDGWPYIKDMKPSAEESRPVFTAAGIDEVNGEVPSNGINITPKLVRDTFLISEKSGEPFTWQIVSLSGEKMKEGAGTDETAVNSCDLPEGMYVVTVKTHAGMSSAKIIKY